MQNIKQSTHLLFITITFGAVLLPLAGFALSTRQKSSLKTLTMQIKAQRIPQERIWQKVYNATKGLSKREKRSIAVINLDAQATQALTNRTIRKQKIRTVLTSPEPLDPIKEKMLPSEPTQTKKTATKTVPKQRTAVERYKSRAQSFLNKTKNTSKPLSPSLLRQAKNLEKTYKTNIKDQPETVKEEMF